MTDALFNQDAYLKTCQARVVAVSDEGALMLDQTVFYPSGGGQPGDAGQLILENGECVAISNTLKGGEPGSVLHILEDGRNAPAIGARVTAQIDWPRRYAHMRMHSCLHLLSAVLPFPVTGGQVGAEKSRLDFAMEKSPVKADVTQALNRLIGENHEVRAQWIDERELAQNPELVKTMSVKPPQGAGRVRLIRIEGCDVQACGGTHVKRTGEIGSVHVTKIVNKGRQNRRVTIMFGAE